MFKNYTFTDNEIINLFYIFKRYKEIAGTMKNLYYSLESSQKLNADSKFRYNRELAQMRKDYVQIKNKIKDLHVKIIEEKGNEYLADEYINLLLKMME